MTFKDFLKESMDEAKFIRTALKNELGLSNRDVSVKSRHYSSVSVDVKSMKALAKYSQIKEIGNSQESIDRDEATGEILQGGNTFIFVSLDYDFGKKLSQIIQTEFDKKARKANFPESDNVTIKIYNRIKIQKWNENYMVSIEGVKGYTKPTECYNLNHIGSCVVSAIQSANDDSLWKLIK